MIIKNNFNDKDANPLSDYKSIGRTRDNIFSDKDDGIEDNLNNEIIKDIIDKDHEYEEEDVTGDKWNFFK